MIRPLLEKIASQVKPVMTKRGWKVGILGEVSWLFLRDTIEQGLMSSSFLPIHLYSVSSLTNSYSLGK